MEINDKKCLLLLIILCILLLLEMFSFKYLVISVNLWGMELVGLIRTVFDSGQAQVYLFEIKPKLGIAGHREI